MILQEKKAADSSGLHQPGAQTAEAEGAASQTRFSLNKSPLAFSGSSAGKQLCETLVLLL